MRQVMRLLVLLSLPATGVAPARAQAANNFAAVIQDPGHRQAVLDAARQTPAWAQIACPAAAFNAAPEIAVYVPVRFNAAAAPIAGVWREGIVATGCGAAITLNVLTKITAPGILATGPLLPGGTIADPVLQNAAQAYAVRAAGGLPAGCADGYVADTEFAGYEGPADKSLPAGEQAAPWREIWTMSLCGPSRRVMMHFAPGQPGVTINAGPQ
jgi:hypothetical protein